MNISKKTRIGCIEVYRCLLGVPKNITSKKYQVFKSAHMSKEDIKAFFQVTLSRLSIMPIVNFRSMIQNVYQRRTNNTMKFGRLGKNEIFFKTGGCFELLYTKV